MSYLPPNRVTCVPGYATDTTCLILVATLSDPTANAVTLTINGVDTYVSGAALTLTAFGTDGAEAQVCWTGVVEVSGLTSFTRNNWSVDQPLTGSDSGSFMTIPVNGEEWAFEFFSCDNNTNLSNKVNKQPQTVHGRWTETKEYIEKGELPLLGALFVDDLGYVDAKTGIADNFDGTATGLEGLGTLTEHDYAIAWCCMLGMLGPTRTVYTATELSTDNELLGVLWGRDEDRSYCRKNLNIWPQWGDHEFSGNDLGWDDLVTTVPNARYLSTGPLVDGVGKTAWDAFLGGLQPPFTGTDTVANHWVMTIGDVTIAAIDGISRSDMQSGGTGTTLLGTDQIEDILTAVDTAASAFTLFGMPNGIKYLSITPSESGSLTQHPIFNSSLADYQRLFTTRNLSPASIMDNVKTNGIAGGFATLHGDLHFGNVQRQHGIAYSTNAAEEFTTIHLGTTNGSQNFDNSTGLNVGDTFSDTPSFTDVLQLQATESGSTNWEGLRIESRRVSGSRQLHFKKYNTIGQLVWDGNLVQYGTNRLKEIGFVPNAVSPANDF